MTMKINNWSGLSDADDKRFEELTEKYVPTIGMASSVGGELLRCINRIAYRYFNDGDTVDRCYGCTRNILKGANTYLRDKSTWLGFNYTDMQYLCEGDKYITILFANIKSLFNFVVANPQVFEMPNDTDTCKENCPVEDYDDEEEEYYEEWEPVNEED